MESPIKWHLNYAVIAIVLTGVVFYVSLLPKEEIPKVSLFQVDKLVHFTMYFCLTLLYFKAFTWNRKQKIFNYLIAGLLAFLVGIIVEILQHFVTNTRFFDVFDIFANTLGIIFSVFLLKKLSLNF